MRLIASVAGLTAIALLGFGVTLAGSQTGPNLKAWCQLSRAEALQAGRIVNRNNSYRSDSRIEAPKVLAYLNGGPRPTGVTTHMGKHLVAGEDLCRALEEEPPPTTTTTTTDTTTTTTTTTEPPPPGDVTLQAVDGGTSYYSQFTNTAGMDAPGFFPIGVWGAYNQTQANRDLDASAGINTYVWAADPVFFSQIRADGRFRVFQDESSDRSQMGTENAGWLLGDEFDMTAADGWCPSVLNQIKSGLPSDGRLTYVNYGKGLSLPPGSGPPTNWWADAAEQNCAANAVNVASVDFYWFSDPFDNQDQFGYKYGESVAALRAADATDGHRHPNWNVVEAASCCNGSTRSITPAEMRSAVWHSIIAGARGIIYFQHSFGSVCTGDHHVLRSNCAGTRPMATSVNAQIASLAPVLNSPSVTTGHSAVGNARYLVKWDGQNFYVLAGAKTAGGSFQFSMPCVGNATVSVLGESRTVPMTSGAFSDTFSDKNGIHIYRVDGGARCGL